MQPFNPKKLIPYKDPVPASDYNQMARIVAALMNSSVGNAIVSSNLGIVQRRQPFAKTETVWGKLKGQDGYQYSWEEQHMDETGVWIKKPGGLSGTLTENTAYEVNQNDTARPGDIFLLRKVQLGNETVWGFSGKEEVCDISGGPFEIDPDGSSPDPTSWPGSPLLQLTKLYRTAEENVSGDKILWGFTRIETYYCGKLVHISAETRYKIAETCEGT